MPVHEVWERTTIRTMPAKVTARSIAEIVRAPGISIEIAANLIQAFADATASGAVVKAVDDHRLIPLAAVEAPLTRKEPT